MNELETLRNFKACATLQIKENCREIVLLEEKLEKADKEIERLNQLLKTMETGE
jgi:hypothetical protein